MRAHDGDMFDDEVRDKMPNRNDLLSFGALLLLLSILLFLSVAWS